MVPYGVWWLDSIQNLGRFFMKSPRAGQGNNPHAVAAIASVFVIVAGAGVGAYLVRFRGTDAGVPLTAAELGILAGGLAGIAVATHFAVVAAVRQTAAHLRELLAHALEVDATDPQAATVFDSEPQLRDLVNMWIGEKNQTRDLGDRLETMRGEIDGLMAGMQRSAHDLRRLRSDDLSPLGVQIVGLWNVILDRVHQPELTSLVPATPPPALAAPAVLEVRALVDRLDELESELERLRRRVQEPVVPLLREEASLETAVGSHDKVQMLLPETEDDIQEDLLFTPSVQAEHEWGDVHTVHTVSRAQPWQLEGEPVTLTEPAVLHVEASRVAALPPAVDAGEAAYDPYRAEVVAVVPGAAWPKPAPAPADRSGAMRFEDLDFPHFVGKPVRDVSGRVAVTYDAETASESGELPASSLLFDDEPPAAPSSFDFVRSLPPERSR